MEIPRDPTAAEIAQFLITRSGGQMVQIVQAIREPAAQAALTASLLFAPPPIAGRSAVPEKAKKALNAFVGFRCYYISIPVFKPWPMKKLSNLMGAIWEADPNKSLWSLMAKAWSTIRDQIGKDKPPLDQFFRIICPYLNMPSPETYLELYGWDIIISKEGGPMISRDLTTEPAAVSGGMVDSAISVEDIISYCQSIGYAQEYVSSTTTTSPTFLGLSIKQAAGKSPRAKVTTQKAGLAYESRVIARNKRRAKRQSARHTGISPSLQAQIFHTHASNETDSIRKVDTQVLDNKISPFYENLADLLTDHLNNGQDNNRNISSNIESDSIAFRSDTPAWTNWNAFRAGADENATLPSFDPTSL
uniref:Mating-type protein MAT-1 n=1 Tax=Pseudopyrenochaeta lycopersici TaxID=285811 RepID=A0A077K1Z0_9PLEO|nr:mating type protein 1 [Pseudopyrenochaeta lycopersici]